MGNKGSAALEYAKQQVGKPYVFGANGPNAFDCSGLTSQAYKHAGISIGRTTYEQVKQGKAVSKKDLQPGDLIFPSPSYDHVQMYTGNGKIVEAGTPRTGVRNSVVTSVYVARRYDDGRDREPAKQAKPSGGSTKSRGGTPAANGGPSGGMPGSGSGNGGIDYRSIVRSPVVVLVLALGFIGLITKGGK